MSTKAVPLTCHGHSRPVPHLSFSSVLEDNKSYLISACKDGNPMLRDGVSGDWIGTFIGHKGAVWQARLSADATMAATASADYSAKVWDPHTGECYLTLNHGHVVRAVAFPPSHSPQMLATGGNEKKFRIFDLTRSSVGSNDSSSPSPTSPGPTNGQNGLSNLSSSYEIGAGIFEGAIKSIVWGSNHNVLVTVSDDNKLRWWDPRTPTPISTFEVEGPVGSCELNSLFTPALSVAAGMTAYVFSDTHPGQLIKKIKTRYEIASAAVHVEARKFVTGGSRDTWVRVYDLDEETELEVHKGHHGPIWSASFSPDGKLYATGSEDGTVKLWKFCSEPYGLWK